MLSTDQSFFLPGDCKDPAYRNVRDNPDFAEDRAFVESLWTRYPSYLRDRTCRSNARNDFLARFWEMYLAVTLRERGFKLERFGNEGPEFYFMHNNRKVWIEAVAPGPGNTEDQVPDYFSREVTKIGGVELEIMVPTPVEKIILRFTGVLFGKDGKKDKYFKAVEKGIIAQNDLYILAINSRGIPYAAHRHPTDIPYFVQAFLRFGNMVWLWNTKTGEIDKTFYQKRENVIKAKGAPVSTSAGLDTAFAFVSAVLHSAVNCVNHPAILGEDFSILHWPAASPSHRLDPSFFSWCEQWFYQDDQLERRPPNRYL